MKLRDIGITWTEATMFTLIVVAFVLIIVALFISYPVPPAGEFPEAPKPQILQLGPSPFVRITQEEGDPVPDITMAELVEFLSVYDVRHWPKGHPWDNEYFAYTDRKNHTVNMLDMGDQSDAKDTILHEFGHVKCYKLMLHCSEDTIEAMSQRVYRQLFLIPAAEAK